MNKYYSDKSLNELFINLEIITAMVLAVGMIFIIISELAGTIIIIFGIITLIFIYTVRLLFPSGLENSRKIRYLRITNNIGCILALCGILVMIIQIYPMQLFFIVSITILAALIIVNGLNVKTKKTGFNRLTFQIRLLVIGMLLVIFYLLT